MTDHDELLDIDAVCKLLGGTKPVDPATVYRGIARGDIDAPVHPTPGTSRWWKSGLLRRIKPSAEQVESGEAA